MTDYDYVLEFIPSVKVAFERAGMVEEAMKCYLLEAMALKQSGRREDALSLLTQVDVATLRGDVSTLPARIVAEIGDLHQLNGETQEAMAAFSKAVALLGPTEVCLARADLKMFVGAAHWGEGQLMAALDAFRSSLGDYAQLGMTPRVTYMRLYIADTLLRLDRAREAEWEILAALPTIEEQKMVPEGFAAVALLKESVRRRKTDPNALRELREHLQASK
jgi:tetratricopeptide (TPR) repeat protein